MKTNDSGETRFDEMGATRFDEKNEQRSTSEQPESTGAAKKTKMSNSLLAGIAGAAAGIAGGAVLSGFVLSPEKETSPGSDPGKSSQSGHSVTEPEQFKGEEVPIADNVTDDMKFGRAFATAREEVGPGGVFEWRGRMYNTYYREEWESFSDEYKHQFSSYNYHSESDGGREGAAAQAIDNPEGGEIIINNHGGKVTINNPGEATAPDSHATTGAFLDTPEHITLPDGTNVIITCLYSDDNADEPSAAFIDVDKDGVYDIQVFADGSILPLDTPMTYGQLQSAGRQGDLLLANDEIYDGCNPVVTAVDDDHDVVVLYGEIDGHQIAYVPTVVDGDEVVFVDGIAPDEQGQAIAAPMDGNYDIAIVNDSETGEAQVLDLTGKGVDNACIQSIQDDPSANYPDYAAESQTDFNNDANVDTFIV